MKVTLDAQRILHLLLLLSISYLIGQFLVSRYEWKPFSAYGFGCTLTCNISNAVVKMIEGGNPIAGGSHDGSAANTVRREHVLEKRKKRRENAADTGANPKKMK
mmetsp:Transcript_2090/g.3872  ORF Transcript_2090/g.3872 Transcript_2090/m.3872 type:complete len:104 (-) Transcript_2090:505-816(-)